MVYGILFRATAETLRTIAADPRHLGAAIGFFAVLHTWGQTLMHHPHLHCVVPGGGLSPDGTRWIACRPGFFLPVRVLSRLFRRLFLEALQAAFDAGSSTSPARSRPSPIRRALPRMLQPARQTEWVVYAKRPFAGPQQVLDYVGRYTHRVAIANQRLLDMDDGPGPLPYKDYRADPSQAPQTMTLDAPEFIRRFLLHVLPTGFHRIRYYGFLGAAIAPRRSPAAGNSSERPRRRARPKPRRPRGLSRPLRVPHGVSLRACPLCADGHMIVMLSWQRGCSTPALPDTS